MILEEAESYAYKHPDEFKNTLEPEMINDKRALTTDSNSVERIFNKEQEIKNDKKSNVD